MFGRGTICRLAAAVAMAAPALAPSRATAGELARPSDAFVDSIGINTHAAFPWVPSSTDWARAIQAIGDIGIRNVRDIPDDPARLNALSAATGARIDVIVQSGWGNDFMDADKFATAWANTQAVNNIGFLELPNEPEPYANWVPKIRAWTQSLHAAKTADPRLAQTPIISTYVWAGNEVADVAPLLDYGNIHSYPGGLKVDANRDAAVGYARRLTGDKPIIATESGYTNNYALFGSANNFGVPEATDAKYMPRLFLDYYNAGIVKTFDYDLMDDGVDTSNINGEAHFGLLRTDFSYKPAAVAVKNLIALLKDPGDAPFAPSSLAYTITGATADVRHTLLQKRDGTFWLAVWQEVLSVDVSTHQDLTVAPLNLGLHLDVPLVRSATYVPNLSADAQSTTDVATHLLGLAVDDRVTLVQLQLAAPGDANADGAVNDADLAIFMTNYGVGTTWEQGDFNLDGKVGFVDFQMLETHYGEGFTADQWSALAAAGVPTPEPGAIALAAAALAGCAMKRRRR